MILPTIINYLKTNATITDVRKRQDNVVNPGNCKGYYLVVWEDTSITNLNDNGVVNVKVSCHAPIGNDAIVDAFILFELKTLLDRVVLTDTNNSSIKYKSEVTGFMSPLVSMNPDKSVSRERLINIPMRWR